MGRGAHAWSSGRVWEQDGLLGDALLCGHACQALPPHTMAGPSRSLLTLWPSCHTGLPWPCHSFGDSAPPGLLVAYCHRFDIQVQSSRIYFVACTIGR